MALGETNWVVHSKNPHTGFPACWWDSEMVGDFDAATDEVEVTCLMCRELLRRVGDV